MRPAKNANWLDLFESLQMCRNCLQVEQVWQELMSNLGYAKSGIVILERGRGGLSLNRIASDWSEDVISTYTGRSFFHFDLASNPLRTTSVLHADHIQNFSTNGKPDRVNEFVQFISDLNVPGAVAFPIEIAKGLRLSFNAWSNHDYDRFTSQTKANHDSYCQAALAVCARYLEITKGNMVVNDVALTMREQECLLLLASGRRQAEISSRLGIELKTVEMHIKSAREKFKAKTTIEAVALAITRGVISP